MAYQIVIKKRFTLSVQKVLSYLEKEWPQKVSRVFIEKIDRRLQLLSSQPYIGTASSKVKNVRGLLITRHNKLYYKIKGDKVIRGCCLSQPNLIC